MRWGRKHDCLNDCMDLRLTILEMFQLQENRISDLEQALKEAGIRIPFGYAMDRRRERIEEGKRIMGL